MHELLFVEFAEADLLANRPCKQLSFSIHNWDWLTYSESSETLLPEFIKDAQWGLDALGKYRIMIDMTINTSNQDYVGEHYLAFKYF